MCSPSPARWCSPSPPTRRTTTIGVITGRERVDLVLDPDAARAEIDLDRLDRLFR